jgi:hypothetical protein
MARKKKGKRKALSRGNLEEAPPKTVPSLELLEQCSELCNDCQRIYIKDMLGLTFRWSNGEYGVSYTFQNSPMSEQTPLAASSLRCDHGFHRRQIFISMHFRRAGFTPKL